MGHYKKIIFNRRMLLGVVVFILLLIALAFAVNKRKEKSDSIESPLSVDTSSPSESFSNLKDFKDVDAFNVLLLGYGGAGHDGGFLTDVIQLIHFDFTNDVLGFISIPRDLWVTFPNGGQAKINSAFVSEDTPQYPTEDVSLDEALAGAVNTKSVIENVTGLTPHFFVGIDFNSFISVIDTLDGVDVDVPVAFEDPWYPVKGRELELCGHTPDEVTEMSNTLSGFELEKQFPCRYEELSFKKGERFMDGDTALKFVRSRHGSNGGDFDRSRRQQALLLGVRDGLLSEKVFNDPVKVFKTLQSSVRTNLNENLINNIAPIISGIGSYKIVHITLSNENVLRDSRSSQGAYILEPNVAGWNGVQDYIVEQLGSKPK
ncbi:LCP family protein [Patescibacteria group bacterium]